MFSTLALILGTTPLGGSPFSNWYTVLAYLRTCAFSVSGCSSVNGVCMGREREGREGERGGEREKTVVVVVKEEEKEKEITRSCNG